MHKTLYNRLSHLPNIGLTKLEFDQSNAHLSAMNFDPVKPYASGIFTKLQSRPAFTADIAAGAWAYFFASMATSPTQSGTASTSFPQGMAQSFTTALADVPRIAC
jgi:hypothetical protein